MLYDIVQHICYEIRNEMFEMNARQNTGKEIADFSLTKFTILKDRH
jgi:hypothetical protein